MPGNNNPTRYIVSLEVKKGLILQGVIGLGAFLAGLDMAFFNIIVPSEESKGFIFSTWFLIVIGSMILFSIIYNLISPTKLIVVNKEGIWIKARPGFTRKLTLIPWNSISKIEKGTMNIGLASRGARNVLHDSVKITVNQDTPLKKPAITEAMVHWQKNSIDIDTTSFKSEIDDIIKGINRIRTNPDRYSELNLDFNTFKKNSGF